MRIGMETCQRRLKWHELVGRVGLAEEAGFDGA